jgi:hypothetical protein
LTSFFRSRRIRRGTDGRYELRLPPVERSLLAQLPEALTTMLDTARGGAAAAPEAVRLFPPAYPEDATAEHAYRQSVHGDLVERHRAAFETVAATVGARSLDDEQIGCWLGALNDVRLVLGTTLGVSEEGPPPLQSEVDEARWALYNYLSLLVEQMIDAMSGALPPPAPGADDLVPDDPWGEPPPGLRWSAPGVEATDESLRSPGAEGPVDWPDVVPAEWANPDDPGLAGGPAGPDGGGAGSS